jgi:hypothetical protein
MVPPPNCRMTSFWNRSRSIWPAWIPPDATGNTPGIEAQSWSKKIPFSGLIGTWFSPSVS